MAVKKLLLLRGVIFEALCAPSPPLQVKITCSFSSAASSPQDLAASIPQPPTAWGRRLVSVLALPTVLVLVLVLLEEEVRRGPGDAALEALHVQVP